MAAATASVNDGEIPPSPTTAEAVAPSQQQQQSMTTSAEEIEALVGRRL